MHRALELAARAIPDTRPNPAVGAVITTADGELLGEGYHRKAGMPHAEIEALNDARARGNSTHGATMYVTLEPCNHTGRTGPCSEAILKEGIARVCVAMRDPNGAARGGIERLRDAGVEVDFGLLESAALLLNPGFNTYHLLKRPLITLKWAMTLDGCTAVPGGDSKWITGEAARAEVHRHRAAHDAVLAGIGTVLNDQARLNARGVALPAGPPLCRLVLDSQLRLPTDAPFIGPYGDSRAIVVCAEDADQGRQAALEAVGVEVWQVKRGPSGVSLPDLMIRLYEQGVQSLYVEGGRTVAGRFAEHSLTDRIEAWIAPKLAGGGAAHLGPMVRSEPLQLMSEASQLHHSRLRELGGDFLLEGWLTEHLFPGGRGCETL